MASYFLDTSALVKRYHNESGTIRVDAIFAETGSSRVISRMGLMEIVSALALKVRTREIGLAEFTLARKRVLDDVGQRVLLVGRVLASHFRIAEELLTRHAPLRRLRTLDAIQLAIALDFNRRHQADSFVCADQSLCEVAALEGLSCINPSPP